MMIERTLQPLHAYVNKLLKVSSDKGKKYQNKFKATWFITVISTSWMFLRRSKFPPKIQFAVFQNSNFDAP